MSEDDDDIDDDEEDGEEEEEGSGGGKKKLFLIIGLVVLLLGGGGAGAYFMFAGGEPEEEEVVVIPAGPPVYHEFPQMVVDLKKKGNRTNYIKLKVVIEIVTRDLPILVARELKIVDKMQGYLRSQTRDDVAGGIGTEKMREGITNIVTEVMGEVKIEGILFREILLQ
jgi:flagellar FliL protein